MSTTLKSNLDVFNNTKKAAVSLPLLSLYFIFRLLIFHFTDNGI